MEQDVRLFDINCLLASATIYLMTFCHDLTSKLTGDIIIHNNQLVVPEEKSGLTVNGGFILLTTPMNTTISSNYITLYTLRSQYSTIMTVMLYP